MTLEEFYNIDWHRGNMVRLTNGKEYLVKGIKSHGMMLLLYSDEYHACFVADHRIIECRTSDYEEPIEIYLQKRQERREAIEARRAAERQEYLRMKEERKQRNIEEQERIHQEALARKAAKAALAREEREKNKAKKSESKPVVKEEPAVKEEPVVEAAPAAEEPKKKRKRITFSRGIKIEIK